MRGKRRRRKKRWRGLLYPPFFPFSHRSLIHSRLKTRRVSYSSSPSRLHLSFLSLSQSFPVTLLFSSVPSLCLSLPACAVYLFEHGKTRAWGDPKLTHSAGVKATTALQKRKEQEKEKEEKKDFPLCFLSMLNIFI